MGREIRRVPPNYEHPKNDDGRYQPQFDENYDEAAKEWLEKCMLWAKGAHPDQDTDYKYYWEYQPTPDSLYYKDYKDEEATWYQVYETVSEGTPVTPPFETQKELIEYLVNSGDFWDQIRYLEGGGRKPGYSREAAAKFVLEVGFAMSMAVNNGIIKEGIESVI